MGSLSHLKVVLGIVLHIGAQVGHLTRTIILSYVKHIAMLEGPGCGIAYGTAST